MTLSFEATYEDGTLKLEQPLPLEPHERVWVTVHRGISHSLPTCAVWGALAYLYYPSDQHLVRPRPATQGGHHRFGEQVGPAARRYRPEGTHHARHRALDGGMRPAPGEHPSSRHAQCVAVLGRPAAKHARPEWDPAPKCLAT